MRIWIVESNTNVGPKLVSALEGEFYTRRIASEKSLLQLLRLIDTSELPSLILFNTLDTSINAFSWQKIMDLLPRKTLMACFGR